MKFPKGILSQKHVLAVRKNHALEHATITILGKQVPNTSLSGYSDTRGFWITGRVSIEQLTIAVEEGLARLKAGEGQLAYHPNCGTNYVTMGTAAGLAAWMASLGMKKSWADRFDRLPLMILFSTVALIAAQPLAYNMQTRITTTTDLGELQITRIEAISTGKIPVYRVFTH